MRISSMAKDDVTPPYVKDVIAEIETRIKYLEQPNNDHIYGKGGIHASVKECGACSQMWVYIAVVDALKRPAFCGDCDGVGWVEGGTAIQTECARCSGSGWEPMIA